MLLEPGQVLLAVSAIVWWRELQGYTASQKEHEHEHELLINLLFLLQQIYLFETSCVFL